MPSKIPTPEFSRLLPLERIGGQGCQRSISANAEERAALARRFDLLVLDRLEAALNVRPKGNRLVLVEGECEADVSQSCVVSLEPVRQQLRFAFQQAFTTASGAVTGHEVSVSLEEEDPAEEIGPRGLDLGEIVAQQLAVNLDPYPRASDAELADLGIGSLDVQDGADPETKPSAFAALRDFDFGKKKNTKTN